MKSKKRVKRKKRGGSSRVAHGSANLRELANSFRRMGDDANHIRLSHLKPRRRHIKSDTMIRETWAARADAYYNCMRHIQVLLPTNEKLSEAS